MHYNIVPIKTMDENVINNNIQYTYNTYYLIICLPKFLV